MAEIKQIGDVSRTDPAKVARLIMDLAKSHGWHVTKNGMELACTEAGLETYTVSYDGRDVSAGITLPDRPYTVFKVDGVLEIKSE